VAGSTLPAIAQIYSQMAGTETKWPAKKHRMTMMKFKPKIVLRDCLRLMLPMTL
jgi:hypothetical protein